MPLIVNSALTFALFFGTRVLIVKLMERSGISEHMYYKATFVSALIIFVIGRYIFPLSLTGLLIATAFFLFRTYRNGYQ
jgi:hypothetical protein